MDPGEILRGHHISNFEKEITRDNRLHDVSPETSFQALRVPWYEGRSSEKYC